MRELARTQRLVPAAAPRRSTPLLSRLEETRRILAQSRERIAAAAARDTDIGPAGDWLLDNYFVVLEHANEVRDSLPRGYYRELPELAAGPLAGYPRVYELAITLISHTEGRIDARAHRRGHRRARHSRLSGDCPSRDGRAVGGSRNASPRAAGEKLIVGHELFPPRDADAEPMGGSTAQRLEDEQLDGAVEVALGLAIVP
jgi:hypothetical protein